jgi:small subunit ribosomal protein S6
MIFSPVADSETVEATLERIGRTVTEDGGSWGERQEWGVRRLAYPIRHSSEGNYVVTQVNMGPDTVKRIEKGMTGAQNVLRYLLVKKDR